MSTSNTPSTTHPHHQPTPQVQPIETSAYTYDTHRPSALATRNLISQDSKAHSPTSPSGPTPTPSRIHPHPVEHRHHERHHTHHPEHEHEHDQHTHTHAHDHNHGLEHHSPASPTSTIGSDSVQEGTEGYAGAGRRQSWSKDDMKRGVMEGLLEKGKGKQAKGGYSSTA